MCFEVFADVFAEFGSVRFVSLRHGSVGVLAAGVDHERCLAECVMPVLARLSDNGVIKSVTVGGSVENARAKQTLPIQRLLSLAA